ncbi:MAG: translation initiation factor IF-2 subunit alpha [Candidatus Altiarchaeales archaeon]|nr:translation initiation factor IF-2 subunit alpha [Candidatus Altiarchaeales archaeon]MBD3415763.1 translation initiation factor IF-2 subunit alpha [Candidatus Altiarchaeales archaeon]
MADGDYPEPGELVIGTVKSIFNQGAFIDLDEYTGRRGMLHLSEISLKWVRNIRDYVKEGQKVVVVVLRIDPKRGHIDLSLRRVNDSQRKQKLQQVKQKQRALKLLELMASELKLKPESVTKKLSNTLSEYDSLYSGLEAISLDEKVADGLDIPDKWRKKLVELVKKSIKPPVVEVTGFVKLQSFESDGVEMIKSSLREILKHKPRDCDMELNYVSAPLYRVKVRASDYKKAEKAMRKAVDQGISYVESHKGNGEFHRELEGK